VGPVDQKNQARNPRFLGRLVLEVEILSPEKFMSRDKAVIQQSGAVAIRSAIKVTALVQAPSC
jgi:hypothetical protein